MLRIAALLEDAARLYTILDLRGYVFHEVAHDTKAADVCAKQHTPGHQVPHGLRQCLQAHQMLQRAPQQHGLISVGADCLQVARVCLHQAHLPVQP